MLKTAAVVLSGVTLTVLTSCNPPSSNPLTVALAESPTPAVSGQIATYVVAVHNEGDHAIENIQLQVSLQTHQNKVNQTAGVISETSPCQGAAGQQACQVGVLPKGNIKRYTFKVRVPTLGTLTGQAFVSVAGGTGYSSHTTVVTTPIR